MWNIFIVQQNIGTFSLAFQIDKSFIPGLMYIRGLLEQSNSCDPFALVAEGSTVGEEEAEDELESLDMPFSVVSASGESKSLSKEFEKVSTANAHLYIVQAINHR